MSKWTEHVERWKDCKLCDLCEQRDRIVLARGSIPCEILFVGEAPGESENVIGQPFKGPAGQLLDQIVERSVKLKVAFTNLVACFPKEAKDAGINEPNNKEITACRPRLKEMVELCRPRLIVTVGELAKTWTPGATQKIELLKGQKPIKWCHITHPAHILRMPVVQQGFAIQKCIVVLRNAVASLDDEA